MLKLREFILGVAITFFALSASAQMYSDSILDQKAAEQRENVAFTLSEQLVASLPGDIRQQLQGVRLEMPRRDPLGSNNPPLAAYADPRARTVILPAATLTFWSDLPIVWAWFTVRECEDLPLIAYIERVVTGRETRPPLEYFSLLVGELLRNPVVDDISLQITNTAINFILAHELAHVYYQDRTGISGPISIQQEMRADAFALELLAAANIPPIGIVYYFTAARFLDPQASEALASTHPVSPVRLRAIAERMKRAPDDYLAPDISSERAVSDRERILFIAHTIAELADLMDDNETLDDELGLLDTFSPPEAAPQACPV